MKPIYIATITLLLIGVGLFYWYEIRPSNIRRMCSDKVTREGLAITTNFERKELDGNMNKINAVEREKGKYWYEDCLHENGLER